MRPVFHKFLMKNNALGFSLLELSIVLVIIGLITGGIMAGRSMVRAAELRSVLSDVNKYKSALNTFREKYQAIPGDMKNAVRYWGAQAGGTADGVDSTCSTLTYMSPATGTATCNGDGNGTINSSYEQYRAWQHLANAGLVEGQYTGVPGSGGGVDAVPGQNIPAAKISGVGYALRWLGTYGDASHFTVNYAHEIRIAAYFFTGLGNFNPFLTPAELGSLDQKVDDGIPGTGQLVSNWNSCTTAASQADYLTASYAMTSAGNLCYIHFVKMFPGE